MKEKRNVKENWKLERDERKTVMIKGEIKGWKTRKEEEQSNNDNKEEQVWM